jgi:hypothetical protein
MAFGVNAGVVPLLFLQTLYPSFFYSATILQAWFWFLVIPLVIVAYYCIYLSAFGIYRKLCSIVTCVLLSWVGLTFASSFSLIENPSAWAEAFQKMPVVQKMPAAGAVYGISFYLTPSVFLRLGMMAGMACGTVAAFLALDSRVFHTEAEYQKQSTGLVFPLYLLGLLVYGVCGYLYRPTFLGVLDPVLFWITALSMPLAVAISLFCHLSSGKALAWLLLVSHLVVMVSNAISRQIVQNYRLEQHLKLSDFAVQQEWGSFIVFVVVLVLGIATLGWIIHTLVTSKPVQKTA